MKHITQYIRDERRKRFWSNVADILQFLAAIALAYFCFLALSILEPITR